MIRVRHYHRELEVDATVEHGDALWVLRGSRAVKWPHRYGTEMPADAVASTV
ncbi:hypothetical protein ACLBYD_15880 [Rhodococcus sp. C26F]